MLFLGLGSSNQAQSPLSPRGSYGCCKRPSLSDCSARVQVQFRIMDMKMPRITPTGFNERNDRIQARLDVKQVMSLTGSLSQRVSEGRRGNCGVGFNLSVLVTYIHNSVVGLGTAMMSSNFLEEYWAST